MKKGKCGEIRGKMFYGLMPLLAFVMILTPVVFADEGTESSGGGWWSGLKNSLSNLTSGSFSELSAEDVGFKPRVKPHISATSSFNSNANLGKRQKDAAWQGRVAPGITVSIPSGKLYTEVDYTYGFSTTQGRRSHANINTHNLNALARYDLSADTIFGVGNNIQFSEVPGFRPGDTFILETATAQVKHRVSSKLTAALTDTFQWFQDKSAISPTVRNNEFNDNGLGLDLTYDVTEDVSVGPSFKWNVRNFEKTRAKDYYQISPTVNASYRIGPKTTLTGNFGWAFRDFERGGSESELVYGASATHLYGRKLVWLLSYAKSLVDTFDTSFVFKERPEATILDNLDRDFRVIKSHRIGTAITYNLDEKNSFNTFGDVQFLSGDSSDSVAIPPTKNNEKAMEIGVGYSYRLTRYLSLDLGYSFGRRFSGDNNATGSRNDYTFHKINAGVNLSV